MCRAFIGIAPFLIFCTSAFSATIYVPDNYVTIQDAINASVNGDTVIVRPGTYVENIDFMGKAITVKSELGAPVTTIDGNQAGSVVIFQGGESKTSILDGFTITNGTGTGAYPIGGGISCVISSPTITNNIITENTADSGGGIDCDGKDCSPNIINNLITKNSAGWDGGGIACWTYSSSGMIPSAPNIKNNTISGNTAFNGGGGITSSGYASPIITNTILWNNSAPYGPELYLGAPWAPSTLSISHSDVKGGQTSVYSEPGCTLNWGAGMIDADPLFADPANNDFHLTWNSPCRNVGDNTAVTELYDFEGDPRIALGTVDMGADEFYPHLYMTGNPTPGSPVKVKIIGEPGEALLLALSNKVYEPPIPTAHGDLYLKLPFLMKWQLGPAPSDGVYVMSANIPSGWSAGSEHPFQALVGPWGGASSNLTNLMTLTVE